MTGAVLGGCGSSSTSTTKPAGGTASTPTGSSSAGSPAAPAGVDTSADPCALLTAADVTKAIGLRVGAGKPSGNGLSESKDCTWSTKFGEGAAYNCATDVTSVVLEVLAPPPALVKRFPTAADYFAELRTTMKMTKHTPQPVPGIGEDAFDAVLGIGKGLDVYALTGNVILRVFSDCGAPVRLRPQLEGLLDQAVAAL